LLSIQRNETIRHSRNPFYAGPIDEAVLKADRKNLMRITGMSKTLITEGIRSLEKAGYIEKLPQRNEYQQFAVTEYLLLNPNNGEPLHPHSTDQLIFANGLHYFTVPACMFKRQLVSSPKLYSFASMTSQEKRLYIALTWLAKQNKASEFSTTAEQLRTLTGLTERSLKKALDGLETRLLVWNSAIASTILNLNIVLRNPVTQELLGETKFDRNPRNNWCNWYEQDDRERSKKADFRMSPELAESLFLKLLEERGEIAQREGNGEWKFCCPFHNDSNPSCSYNPRLGCFHCFSAQCGAKGTTRTLLMQLSGTSREKTIKRIADAMEKEIEYIDPDWDTISIYDYKNKFGILQKQVLRLPNDESGNKRFRQRRLGRDGWIYTTKGMKPMLFNRDALEFADIVFITEGEKDAVTMTNLALMGRYGIAIGTTSGSAASWVASLAKEIGRSKRVVILPDDDVAGTHYADAIEESLKAEGIEYRKCTFSGTGANSPWCK
jgi:5S rRNA maturation endonuclease (ribonuclease M5)/DNA-binding transcriptional ArsR family regulator